MQQYETVIGLEIHVQLKTKSKAFCGDSVAFGNAPNTQTSAISLAHPGTLPKLNERQVDFAIRLGLALGSEINEVNYFDRKNYNYPDLPKGYQITQDKQPICVGGEIPIYVNGKWKAIRIHHLHLEEDAGKLIHDQSDRYSFVDLNRAGTPLLEVVTEPDLRSADEVDALMTGMRQLVRYLDISDGNMQEGSLRCDCNVSIMPLGSKEFGNRCEIKNMNSMRFARKAIEFEVKRQTQVVESGGVVAQQTLTFDPLSGKTAPIRTKENANDYRYFPEPDLPPLKIEESMIAPQRAAVAILPWKIHDQLVTEFGLKEAQATILFEDKSIATFALQMMKQGHSAKAVANLFIQKIIPFQSDNSLTMSELKAKEADFGNFIKLIEEGKVSASIAYERLFPKMMSESNKSVETIANEMGVIQSSDTDEISKIVDKVLAQNPEKVAAYKNGKKGLLGFFMGQLMRASKGKIDPKTANQLLGEKLDSLADNSK